MPRRATERGAVATEYALLASLIAAVIAGSVALFGQAVLDLFAPTATWFN